MTQNKRYIPHPVMGVVYLCLLAVFLFIAWRADKNAAIRPPEVEPNAGNVFPGESWEQREPAQVRMNGAKLDEFATNVGGDGCIIKSGYLIKSWGEQTSHKWWASASKPVLSTLLLLAVQEHKLPSVDAPVNSVGWELSPKDTYMTFRHLANMMSGYACAEPPGTAWGYNDYAIQLYAKSLEKVYHQTLDEAFRQRMAPLQFQDGEFFGHRGGLSVVASPRDFARVGWLWLNRGRWKGEEIVSKKLYVDYIRPGAPSGLRRTMTRTNANDYLGIGTYGGGTDQTKWGPGEYGFNFWFNERLPSGEWAWPALPADTYQANGMWNRDTITIFPSMDLVVAVRGAKPGKFEPGKANGQYNQNMKVLMEGCAPVPPAK